MRQAFAGMLWSKQLYNYDVGRWLDGDPTQPVPPASRHNGRNSRWRSFDAFDIMSMPDKREYPWFGDELTVEYPAGSGHEIPLDLIAKDLQDRLISIFTVVPDGRRPCFGWVDRLQHDPAWKDNLAFNEYFHGDNGAGLGASHQTGWTGLVAELILRARGVPVPTLCELMNGTPART